MEVTRLQVEIPKDQMNELERLQTLGGIRTKKDLLNTAFTLLQWAAREKIRGRSICSIDEINGTYKELGLPFLENIASSPASNEAAEVAAGRAAAARTIAAARKQLEKEKTYA